MSDGQCFSGADTAKSFAKFGHGETECSAMAANNKVFTFDYDSANGMIDSEQVWVTIWTYQAKAS